MKLKQHRFYFFELLLCTVWFFACNLPKENSRNGYVSVRDSKIYYEIKGQGQPVFFVHAGFQDHAMWQTQVEQFVKDGFQVTLIDLPGHGASKDGDSAYLVQDYIKACFDTLNIQKASLVGLSLGGASVTDFALAYPERVEKLVLASAMAVGYEQKYPVDSITLKYFPEVNAAMEKKDFDQAAEIFTKYWCDGMQPKESVDTAVRNYIYHTTRASMKDHGWNRWAHFARPPAINRLDQLKIPTLILYGQYDLPVIHQAADVLVKTIRTAQKKEIKNAAHMINMERPQEFNEAVIDFLKKK